MFITPQNITEFNAPARRIVSVVPSQTELLFSLGLNEPVIGITKFCIHPEAWFKTKARVGGTKTLDIDKIRAIKPDLILANKEENQQEQIEQLAAEFPLYLSDIYTLPDVYKSMQSMAMLTGTTANAETIISKIQQSFQQLKTDLVKRKVLYLIWRKPFMAAGKQTFINHLIEQCGWVNALGDQVEYARYPELSLQEIEGLNPELIFLSSEPYPFKKEHITELQANCPRAKIVLVDGELFSWYGSRLIFSTAHFTALIERIRYFSAI